MVQQFRADMSSFLNRKDVTIVLRLMFAFSFMYLVIGVGMALAQSTAPSFDIGCRIVQYIAQPTSRNFGVVAGGVIAVIDMGRHNQNPGNWMREHWGTAMFCAALVALPAVLGYIFGNNCGLQ